MGLGAYLAAVLFFAFAVPKLLIERTVIDGSSMEPSLHDGENVLVEKVSVRAGGVKRFDIIIFSPEGVPDGKHYVKRVIGLPGETVQIADGKILIDGTPLDESYGMSEEISYAGLAAEKITLAEDEYFVLGDNREVSEDSRYPAVGRVKAGQIRGRVLVRIWPLSVFGTVD